MPKYTDTEYTGKVPTRNSVTDLGPDERKLSPDEKLRLGYLTGQEDDPNAKEKRGFFSGVDPDFPENPNSPRLT